MKPAGDDAERSEAGYLPLAGEERRSGAYD
jgi:hypothetical protein